MSTFFPTFDLRGPRIMVSDHLTEPCEDFSQSRSPSRALRRWRRRGILGRGMLERPSRKAVEINGVIWMHPAMLDALRRSVSARIDRDIQNAFLRAYPEPTP